MKCMFKGLSHPVRMGGHVTRDFSTPVAAASGKVTAGGIIPWPTRPGSTSKTTNVKDSDIMQAVIVPDFVSKPQAFHPSKYGYQEVHALYNEMRSFFAQRATSKYQNEVATIKITLMTLKPNNQKLQMIMVCKLLLDDLMLIVLQIQGHHGNDFQHPSAYRGHTSQINRILHHSPNVPKMVPRLSFNFR